MRAGFLKCAGFNFFLGLLLGNLIAWATGEFGQTIVNPTLVAKMGGQTEALVVQSVLSGLYGVICMGGTAFYDIERWPLALSFAVHYLMIAVSYVPIALFLGWAESADEILVVAGVQLIVYFLIWLVMYLRYRRQVRKLNELQKEHKEMETQEKKREGAENP